MKKIVILGLAFFALSLVSCGKKKEENQAKADCEKKKATHVWNEAKQECEPKPAEGLDQQACAQDPTKKWDATLKEGKGACRGATKEECTLSEVKWDEAKNECVKKGQESGSADSAIYTVTLSANLANVQTVNLVRLEIESKNLIATLSSIGDCVRLKKSDFALVKIATFQTTPTMTQVQSFCGGTDFDDDGEPIQQAACEVNNYAVSGLNNAIQFRTVESPNPNIEKCKTLQSVTGGLN